MKRYVDIAAAVVVGVLVSISCILPHRNIEWAPDGKVAAVEAMGDMRFCTAEGKLSAKLTKEVFDDVNLVRWFPDGERLAVTKRPGFGMDLMILRRGEKGWENGTTLFKIEETRESWVFDVRISPTGKALVFAWGKSSTGESDQTKLSIVNTDGREPTVRLVAERAAIQAEWSADGRTLFYAQASIDKPKEKAAWPGAIYAREVCGEDGTPLATFGEPRKLHEVRFSDAIKIRRLRSGHLVVSAMAKGTIDISKAKARLYEIDPAGEIAEKPYLTTAAEKATAQQHMFLFEISPNERRLAFCGQNSELWVIELDSGKVITLQDDMRGQPQMVPVWRTDEELWFLVTKRNKGLLGEDADRGVVAAWTADGRVRLISKDWPDEVTREWR